jgi:hypothetical protein
MWFFSKKLANDKQIVEKEIAVQKKQIMDNLENASKEIKKANKKVDPNDITNMIYEATRRGKGI